MKELTILCVIANLFQGDYILHYLNFITGKVNTIDFISSSIYPKEKIDSSINFFDFWGFSVENQTLSKRITGAMYYSFSLIKFLVNKPRNGVIHIQWLWFAILNGIKLTFFCRIMGYKTVYPVHDIVPHSREKWINRFIFKVVYNVNWKLIAHT